MAPTDFCTRFHPFPPNSILMLQEDGFSIKDVQPVSDQELRFVRSYSHSRLLNWVALMRSSPEVVPIPARDNAWFGKSMCINLYMSQCRSSVAFVRPCTLLLGL